MPAGSLSDGAKFDEMAVHKGFRMGLKKALYRGLGFIPYKPFKRPFVGLLVGILRPNFPDPC